MDALHAGIMDCLDEALKLEKGQRGPGAALIFLPVSEKLERWRRRCGGNGAVKPKYCRSMRAD